MLSACNTPTRKLGLKWCGFLMAALQDKLRLAYRFSRTSRPRGGNWPSQVQLRSLPQKTNGATSGTRFYFLWRLGSRMRGVLTCKPTLLTLAVAVVM